MTWRKMQETVAYGVRNAKRKEKKRKSKQHQHWSKYTNFEAEGEGSKTAPQCETSGH